VFRPKCFLYQSLTLSGFFVLKKNFVALYHSGIYADKSLHDWFVTQYPKHVKTKLDMGKSCVRFKKVELIPYELLGDLCSKMTVDQWIELYESNIKSR
jgi:hypothetical protein